MTNRTVFLAKRDTLTIVIEAGSNGSTAALKVAIDPTQPDRLLIDMAGGGEVGFEWSTRARDTIKIVESMGDSK
jgi:hypothetical protein